MSRLYRSLNFLIDKFHNISHGHASFIDHCLTTYNILKAKGHCEDLCLAGLFHSVYGTASFDQPTTVDRETIRDIVGENAEQLIYEFCGLENKELDIVNNTKQYSLDFLYMLKELSLANLLAQTYEHHDPELDKLITMTENMGKMNTSAQEIKKLVINGKQCFLLDNVLEKNYVEALHDYCLNSSYKPNHGSSKFTHERDERFACYLSKEEFIDIRLNDVLKEISIVLGFKLYAGNYYINHYSHMAQAGRHCDSSVEDSYTILIFCNKFWESTWGGSLIFYNEKEPFHTLIDFDPGRIIVFDSRLEHEVTPLTINAKRARFSIAVKCATENNLEFLKSSFGEDKIVEP